MLSPDRFADESVRVADEICKMLGHKPLQAVRHLVHNTRCAANEQGILSAAQISREQWIRRLQPGSN